jgi:hypothetical protein
MTFHLMAGRRPRFCRSIVGSLPCVFGCIFVLLYAHPPESSSPPAFWVIFLPCNRCTPGHRIWTGERTGRDILLLPSKDERFLALRLFLPLRLFKHVLVGRQLVLAFSFAGLSIPTGSGSTAPQRGGAGGGRRPDRLMSLLQSQPLANLCTLESA